MPCCGHPLTPFPSVCKESWQQEAHGHCQSRSASNPCNVHCLHPARHLIGAYVLPWHSHRAALALREQVNDWQEDSGYPLYKPQVLSSSHQTPGSPSGLWGDSSILPSTQGDKFRQRESLQCQGSVEIATAKPLCLASSPLHSPLISSLPSSRAQQSWAGWLCLQCLRKTSVLCWLLCSPDHHLASPGSATERTNGKGDRNALKQSNQVRGVRTGRFGVFSLAIIPSVSPFLPSRHHLTHSVFDLLGWGETGNFLAVPRTGPDIP